MQSFQISADSNIVWTASCFLNFQILETATWNNKLQQSIEPKGLYRIVLWIVTKDFQVVLTSIMIRFFR